LICIQRDFAVNFWGDKRKWRDFLKMKVKIVLEPSDEGGYTVYAPSLPGCISEGETIEEAMANIREAIALYLEPVEDDLVVQENVLVRELEL
jgi:predicted RNase H-like HicB family nuclease